MTAGVAPTIAMKLRLPELARPAWLFLASVVIGGVSFSIFQLYFNLYVLSVGADKQQLGLLASIPSGVTLVLGLPLGMLADRMGRRAALIWGNVGAAVATLILVATGSPFIMAAGAILLGISQTIALLSVAPFIMQVSNEKTRTLMFSAQFGLSTLSGFAGSLLAGYMPGWFAAGFGFGAESAEAYRATIAVSAALVFLSNVPLGFIRAEPGGGSGRGSQAAVGLSRLWAQITRPLVIKLMAPNLFIGFGAAILIPYMNVFFKEKFGLSDDWLGILFSVASVTTGTATLLGPRLANRLGKVRAVVATQMASLVFMAFIGFWPGALGAAMAFLFRGALMNMAGPLFQAFSMEQVAEGERATVNSVLTLTWNVGWTFGPALSGWVQQHYGFTPLFAATITLYGIAIVITYWFFRDMEGRPGKMPVGKSAPQSLG